VHYFGGEYCEEIDESVTHLCILIEQGKNYQMVINHPEWTIQLVLPHWIDDCVKLKKRISEDFYRFSDPKNRKLRHPLIQDFK
jgi:hypothetical protein